ncbi:hypothetical protein PoB_003364700 [Plakobranchus ocellatus]|uniref:Uncharacterized protein n=1 Tax=Plakobranchus ocellatus TaxID=259542 RepID=A0AAV4AJG2_9GAST|nr:hypothetical protein PoB_003364700 [Plakobranchus ocellatus]
MDRPDGGKVRKRHSFPIRYSFGDGRMGRAVPLKVQMKVVTLFWRALRSRRRGSGVGWTVGVAGLGFAVDVVWTLRALVPWTQEFLPELREKTVDGKLGHGYQ